jgi:hypothetical protein
MRASRREAAAFQFEQVSQRIAVRAAQKNASLGANERG